jgi:hypothetical protein
MKSTLIYLRNFMLVVALLAISASCHKSNPVAPNPTALQIVPLTVGNTWSYDGVFYDTTGSVLQVYGELHLVQQDSSLYGRTYYVYDGLCANTDSGLVQTYSSPSSTYSFLIYRYPAQLGYSYRSGNFIAVVSQLDTLVQVPAGSFHCIRYTYTYDSLKCYEEYVTPGIGRVKRVAYYSSGAPNSIGHIEDVIQLKTYVLK